MIHGLFIRNQNSIEETSERITQTIALYINLHRNTTMERTLAEQLGTVNSNETADKPSYSTSFDLPLLPSTCCS